MAYKFLRSDDDKIREHRSSMMEWKKTWGRWVALVLCTVLVGFVGCSAPSAVLPTPTPMPEGQSFTGVWYSQQFGRMYLRQVGGDVRGIYEHDDGGTLEGTVDGNMLKFRWLDPGDRQAAVRTQQGHGYLVLKRGEPDTVLEGEWGYDEKYAGGGVWTAEWTREIEADDPRNLEEWKNSTAR
ncbi:MAG: hypothetical protein AAGI01_15325 [Myxococcota bacterium]